MVAITLAASKGLSGLGITGPIVYALLIATVSEIDQILRSSGFLHHARRRVLQAWHSFNVIYIDASMLITTSSTTVISTTTLGACRRFEPRFNDISIRSVCVLVIA